MMQLLRVLGILIGLVVMTGFGLCGAFGVLTGVVNLASSRSNDAAVIVIYGALGLAIGYVAWRLVRRCWVGIRKR